MNQTLMRRKLRSWLNRVITPSAAGLLLLIIVLGTTTSNAQTAKLGTVAGRVVDEETGNPLPGATVRLEGTSLGAYADVDGNYLIRKVPAGTYTVVVTIIGFASSSMPNVVVSEGGSGRADLALRQQLVNLQGAVVSARRLNNSEAAVLKDRKTATAVSDAISAETISRSGGGNAAQAMMRVTGASVADGKYAVIRGLSDRYTNTRLNGSTLPSADPEKQAFNMDLVPSDLLDNIVVTKSYTADQPGNFTGGSVNLVTKDFPDKRTLSISAGSSFNSLVTGKSIISNTGSSTDWLGYDDGYREMPQFLKDNYDRLPQNAVNYRKSYNGSVSDINKALFLDSACKAFQPEYNPRSHKAPINQNYAFSYGDNLLLFGRSLGLVGSISYDRKRSFYAGGESNLYAPIDNSSLEAVKLLRDTRGGDEVLLGGLGSLQYNLAAHHRLGMRYVYNRSGKAETRFLGGLLNDYDPGQSYESHDIDYTKRTLRTVQFNGTHEIRFGAPIRLEWHYSDSRTAQNQNLRQYAYAISVDSTTAPWDTTSMGVMGSNLPAVYWRDITEREQDFGVDLKLGLTKKAFLKLGASYQDRDRTHRQKVIKWFVNDGSLLYNLHGDMDAWVQHAGLTDSSGRFYLFDNYLTVWPSTSDEYDGSQKIPAWYLMAQTPVFKNLSMVAGLRHERTDMETRQLIANPRTGMIHKSEWLPAVNFVYTLTSSMNIRAAYSRTVARPTLREMAPFRDLEFAGSTWYYGNVNLRQTRITNYDLRWEWFMRPNEIVSLSFFYKKFVDPIEIAYTIDNYDRGPVNVPDARNYGVEIEARKQLDRIGGLLKYFNIGGNLTLVHSAVNIPAWRLDLMRIQDPQASDSRPMANQSPYILNLNVGYDNPKTGTAATLLYNVFGRRFYANAVGASPDIYEMPRKQLDLTFSQTIFHGVTFKASARNLLNESFEADYYFIGSGEKVAFKKYEIGRSFSLGMTYKIFQ